MNLHAKPIRWLCLARSTALLCGFLIAPHAAQAQVKLVVPTAAEGSTDTLARLLAEGLQRHGYGAVALENLPGKNGTIAAERVARALPDGDTVLLATSNSHGIAPALQKPMPYDPIADFEPVIRFAAAPYVFVVHPGGPKDIRELALQARSAKAPWRYSSTGQGSPHHLVPAYLFKELGVQLQHEPRKGGKAAIEDVINKQVDVMMPAAVLALPHIQRGHVRAMAVAGDKRMAALPNVPTLRESGSAINLESWYGLVVPKGTPAAKVALLEKAVLATLDEPSIQARFEELAVETRKDRGPAFAQAIQEEISQWKTLVQSLGQEANVSK